MSEGLREARAFAGAEEAPEAVRFDNPPLRGRLREALLRAILSGRFKPGERLVELRLAQEFGTSQGPIREALRDLEATGLVVNRPRRGTYVVEFLEDGLQEIYAARGALEAQATRLATARRTCDIGRLEAELDGMRRAAAAVDAPALGEHSVAFHRIIMEASGNRLLLNLWTSLQIETRTTITLLVGDVRLSQMAESHQPIIDAIRSGDADRAAQVAREHQDFFEAAGLIKDRRPAG